MSDLDLDDLLDDLDIMPPIVAPIDNTEDKPMEGEEGEEMKEIKESTEVEKFEKKLEKNQDLASDEVTYSDEFIDIMVETKKFMEDSFEIDAEIRALKAQLATLKTEAKDIGVPVTAVGKAIKEMVKNIKETPDEAHNVEMMKRFINEDDSLYSEISALAV